METTLATTASNAQRITCREKKSGRIGSVQSSCGHHARPTQHYFTKKYSLKWDTREATAVRPHLQRNSDTFIDKPSCAIGYSYISSQMVLLPDSNYDESKNCDFPPGWKDLASISVYGTEDFTCPICMCPPFAPRMGQCGHIYCWPCAIQYIQYENDKGLKQCAVCSWILALEGLNRVSFTRVSRVVVGDTVRMALVKRSKYSSCIEKVSNEGDGPSPVRFQYVYRADKSLMRILQQNELNDLLTYKALCEEDGSGRATFVDSAIKRLNQEKSRKTISDVNAPNNPKQMDDGNGYESINQEEFFFYQAFDGQPLYLDGLMWRCLLTEYKETAYLPTEFDATVLATKQCRMDSSVRRRLRYLSHLSDGCPFTLVEIELKEPLVSDYTLAQFVQPLKSRETERMRLYFEDLELTQMKEDSENCIPNVAPGFHLAGPVSLTDQKTNSNRDTLVPKVELETTFAAVSRSGARDVIGPGRVANFSRSPPFKDHRKEFNPAEEMWPSLGTSSNNETMPARTSSCWDRGPNALTGKFQKGSLHGTLSKIYK